MFFLRFFKWNIVPLPKDMLMLMGIHDHHTDIMFLRDTATIRPEAILLSFVAKEIYVATFNKYAGTFSPNEIEQWSNTGKTYEEQGDPSAYGRAFEEILQVKYPGYVQQLPDYDNQERNKDVQ